MQNNTLIESVRALAEAQKCGIRIERVSNLGAGQISVSEVLLDFTALLRHLERAERIEKAARAAVEDTRNSTYEDCCVRKGLVCEVLAALLEPQ